MAERLAMGIDIGTTATKTILVNEAGDVRADASAEYPLSMPKPSWYEQDPADWWEAVNSTVRQAMGKVGANSSICAISYSGQMHGLVALDEMRRVVRPCIIWADQRNARQCEEIYERTGGVGGLLSYTNNRMLTGFTGGKILWMKETEPENYGRTRIILNPKDYVRFRMAGDFATEVSDASGTGLLDVRKRRWSKELMELLGIDPSLLPKCYESGEIHGKLTVEAANDLGLPAGIPIVGGGGDAIIAMTGAGIIHEGEFGASLGTGGVIATALDSCYDNPGGLLQVSCHNIPGKWHVMGVTMGAGGAYRWAKETLGDLEAQAARLIGESPYELLNREAARVSPGANGLLFLPHLFGSRCPHDDSNSRGAYIGLTFQHQKGHLLRSVLEGVTYSFKEMAEVIAQMGVAPTQIRVSGGGARGKLWRQIIADVFDCEVIQVSGAEHGGAYGAALVAGVAAGLWPSLEQAVHVLKVETRAVPVAENVAVYKQLFPIFKGLYPALKESMHALWI